MAKSQLPLVTSMMMVTQAVLATPVGLRAKRSIGARNGLLLLGFGAMISADLVFALTNNAAGQPPHCAGVSHTVHAWSIPLCTCAEPLWSHAEGQPTVC